MRLDRFLAGALPDLSRARLQRLIEAGQVTLGGTPVRRARRLKGGELLEIVVPPVTDPEAAPKPQALPLRILYQDDAIVVVDKAAGMAVHPAPGTPDGTLVNALLHAVPDLPGIGGHVRPGIVHRLDKDTSGVMVVAKTDAALSALQAQFKARTVEKVYRALVHGNPPPTGTLDRPIGRHRVHRTRYSSRGMEGRKDARAAVTHWLVREAFEGAAELEVRLETGRTHQIRVHLSDAGHPLLGDALYGSARRDRGAGVREAVACLGRQALHAWRLCFAHPVTGEAMCFEAEVGPAWEAAVAALRGAGSGRRSP